MNLSSLPHQPTTQMSRFTPNKSAVLVRGKPVVVSAIGSKLHNGLTVIRPVGTEKKFTLRNYGPPGRGGSIIRPRPVKKYLQWDLFSGGSGSKRKKARAGFNVTGAIKGISYPGSGRKRRR